MLAASSTQPSCLLHFCEGVVYIEPLLGQYIIWHMYIMLQEHLKIAIILSQT